MTNCEQCGQPLRRRPPSQRQPRFCSHKCFWISLNGKPRRETTKGYRKRKLPHHPLAPPTGIISVSRLVLFDKLGGGSHPCAWCGRQVKWRAGDSSGRRPDDLMVDHLDWNIHNNSPDNLVPTCSVCNSHRTRERDRRLISDDELTMMVNGERTRAVQQVCKTCGEPFLALPAKVKQGLAVYCSRPCYYESLRDRREKGRFRGPSKNVGG